MSKKHTSTIINQDEVNNAYLKDMPAKRPEKPVHPLSLAAWVRRSNKTIYLKCIRGDDQGKDIAKLG